MEMDQNQNENIVKDTETPTADTFLNEEMPRPKTGRARDTLFSRAVFAVQDWLADYGYLLIGAFIPVVLMYLLYLAKEIYPFGDGCVLVLDLNGQYSAFYHGLRDVLKGDASLLYTFCRNMGGEFLGIFDYYVASPFAWLIALFPETRMLEALLVLFLLKTGLLGFNMGFYLHKLSKGNPNRLAVVIISILYALCTYAVVQQHNSMWIDALMWLPLLTLGIEQLIKNKKYKLFVIMLALTLVIPPVGCALLWYKGALDVKLRALVTVLALLLMTLYFSWMLPSDTPEPFQPTVSRPEAVTEYSPSSSASQTE